MVRAWPSLAIFEDGEAPFLRHWASRWSLLQAADSPLAGRVGVAPLPASCLAGQSLALSALSHYPDQAFRLVSFLAGYDQQVRWAQATGLLPALAAACRADPALGALVAALSTARPLPQTAAYPAISEAIYLQTNKLLAGDQDVDTTAAQIQQSIQAAIDQP
jgi:ABC-type glycerol-3-phosphate transport system substrate-binding protein